MAKVLKQVVNQYDVNGLPVRCIVQYYDDVTGEENQSIVNRDDMENPDSNVFDNYEAMVAKFMVD